MIQSKFTAIKKRWDTKTHNVFFIGLTEFFQIKRCVCVCVCMCVHVWVCVCVCLRVLYLDQAEFFVPSNWIWKRFLRKVNKNNKIAKLLLRRFTHNNNNNNNNTTTVISFSRCAVAWPQTKTNSCVPGHSRWGVVHKWRHSYFWHHLLPLGILHLWMTLLRMTSSY